MGLSTVTEIQPKAIGGYSDPLQRNSLESQFGNGLVCAASTGVHPVLPEDFKPQTWAVFGALPVIQFEKLIRDQLQYLSLAQ